MCNNQLWSTDDLAHFLGVSKDTIYEHNYKGTGPRRYKVGRHVRYRPGDVMEWLDRREVM